MARVLLISTGGTLASSDSGNGLAPDLSGSYLIGRLRGLIEGVELDSEELFMLDSSNIQPEEWSLLAKTIYERRKSYDGIVVIHGTDTMAYTAAALSFALQNIEIPVVLTGSQVSIESSLADASENCRAALHMAVSKCPGVYIAFNRKIILGARASKVRTQSFDAFESIDFPYAAKINSNGLVLNPALRRERRGVCELRNSFCTDVFLLKMFPGMPDDILDTLYEKGVRGVYIEAFGIGGLPSRRRDMTAAIRRAVDRGMVIVIGSQCLYEGSDFTVYEVGRGALESGAIATGNMTSEAACAKLMWALGQYGNAEEAGEAMRINLAGEMGVSPDFR